MMTYEGVEVNLNAFLTLALEGEENICTSKNIGIVKTVFLKLWATSPFSSICKALTRRIFQNRIVLKLELYMQSFKIHFVTTIRTAVVDSMYM
jgi:hypothetical protein